VHENAAVSLAAEESSVGGSSASSPRSKNAAVPLAAEESGVADSCASSPLSKGMHKGMHEGGLSSEHLSRQDILRGDRFVACYWRGKVPCVSSTPCLIGSVAYLEICFYNIKAWNRPQIDVLPEDGVLCCGHPHVVGAVFQIYHQVPPPLRRFVSGNRTLLLPFLTVFFPLSNSL